MGKSIYSEDKIPPASILESIWNANTVQTRQLWPIAFEEIWYDKHHWWSFQRPQYMILEFVLEGELLVEYDKKNEIISPGKIFILCRPEKVLFQTGKTGSFHKIAIVLQGNLLDTLTSSFSLENSCISLSAPDVIEQNMRAIGRELDQKEPSGIHRINGMCVELLSRLSEESAQNNAWPKVLNEAIRKLNTKPDTRFSLNDLAIEVNSSVSTLLRCFRKYCGVSPQAYRRQQRLQLAQHLLKNTTLSIKEIADRTGYSNQSYFSNDFKHGFGCSPAAWRQAQNDK